MQFLASSDYHLRPDRPRCRTDEDWIASQETVLGYIAQEANRRRIPVFIFGDEFDTPHEPELIINIFLRFCFSVKAGVRILAGNHSLPYHSWSNERGAAFGVVQSIIASPTPHISNFDEIGQWSHFGEALQGDNTTGLLFLHQLTFPSAKDLPPNVEATTAGELLAEYPDKEWIFTGDMHKSFHYEKKGRHVINPGCITRQVADMKDYQPIVYYVDTEAELVEEIALPDTAELVDDSYLRSEEAREDRISAFIEQVKSSGAFSLSFVDNITTALEAHPELDEATVKTIHELMETN